VVCGTESVCTGPAGAFDGGGRSGRMTEHTGAERIIMIAVTAVSSAAGAM